VKTTPSTLRQDSSVIPVVKASMQGTGRHEQDSCGLPAMAAAAASAAAEKSSAAIALAIAITAEEG
jgi:hypothetical protein